MKNLMILILALTFSIPSLAQSDPAIQAKTLLAEGKKLFEEGTLPSQQAALQKLEEARKLFHDLGDTENEVVCLTGLGRINGDLGDKDKALKYYDDGLTIARTARDIKNEAIILTNIGKTYQDTGRSKEALEIYFQILPLYKEAINESNEATTRNNIGRVYMFLGERAKALDYYNQALTLYRKVADEKGIAVTLSNIGQVYSSLGEYAKALEFYQQALPLRKKTNDKLGEAVTLLNIGTVYLRTKDYPKAIDYYNQSLAIRKLIGDKSGEATTLNNIGSAQRASGDNTNALITFNQALEIYKTYRDKSGEAAVLANIGLIWEDSGDYVKALEYYYRSLPIVKQIGNMEGEAKTLDYLMGVWKKLNNLRIAALFGKQAVNTYQALRKNIKTLDQSTQQSYLSTIEKTYRRLAEILIASGRIIEAEQVLTLLKNEEIFDYLRRNESESGKLSQQATLNKSENEMADLLTKHLDKIAALSIDLAKLQTLKNKKAVLTASQLEQLESLPAQIEEAQRDYDNFLSSLAKEFISPPNALQEDKPNLTLQNDLKSWDNTVLIYTLVGEDRLRIILVTPDERIIGTTEIKSIDLNRKIAKFRELVQDSRTEPKPLAKDLYDIIIKPIEKQLIATKAKTLLWSLDGNLRLLPLAALWDGKQYFGEKYQNVMITLARRQNLNESVERKWNALGLGVTQAASVNEPNQTRRIEFPALLAVKEEIYSIIKSPNSPKGVFTGQILMDQDFNKEKLNTELLRNYKVIHVASHFSLNPGDSTKSFLLLGNNEILTVDEMKNNPNFQFKTVELLTLSACQTAVIEKNENGKEIEGFSYVAQSKGAKSILASLWRVADSSTQELMSDFYRLQKQNPKLTKAEALQMAQSALLKNRKRAHPFYWAPFVLIGNWH